MCHEWVIRIMTRYTGVPAARAVVLPVVLVLAAVAVAGCASARMDGLSKDSPAEVKQAAVGKRAAERWQALIRGDYQGAYAYFSAASREVYPAADFAARMSKIAYRGISVDKVECEAEVCTVSLTLKYDPPGLRMTNVPTPLQENWIIERGQAWFVFRD
jgi:hypothetical protein